MAAACFYHLRCLRQIRRCVREEVITRLVLALVISRFDYCNSLLARLPLCTTESLQRVQNAAAWLIFELSPSEQAYSSYIGYPYAGTSSFNYVALCTHLSPDAAQCIWGASCNPLHICIPVCDCHLSTSLYRGHGTSSTSGPSLTPARLHGTHCRAISVKQSILTVLGSS